MKSQKQIKCTKKKCRKKKERNTRRKNDCVEYIDLTKKKQNYNYCLFHKLERMYHVV